MFLLIDKELYIQANDGYESIDIINGEVVRNEIKTTKMTKDASILTHNEVYAKFHINSNIYGQGKDYLFPRPKKPETNQVTQKPEIEKKTTGNKK